MIRYCRTSIQTVANFYFNACFSISISLKYFLNLILKIKHFINIRAFKRRRFSEPVVEFSCPFSIIFD